MGFVHNNYLSDQRWIDSPLLFCPFFFLRSSQQLFQFCSDKSSQYIRLHNEERGRRLFRSRSGSASYGRACDCGCGAAKLSRHWIVSFFLYVVRRVLTREQFPLQLTETDDCISSRGVAEHSHRSQLATDIVNNMKADLVSFLEVPSTHEVLIMQGFLVPENPSS